MTSTFSHHSRLTNRRASTHWRRFYDALLLIARFHFHDAEISNPCRRHEYQMAALKYQQPSPNIRYANPDDQVPTENPIVAHAVLIISIIRNRADLSSHR